MDWQRASKRKCTLSLGLLGLCFTVAAMPEVASGRPMYTRQTIQAWMRAHVWKEAWNQTAAVLPDMATEVGLLIQQCFCQHVRVPQRCL
jgi:hypothetical protein